MRARELAMRDAEVFAKESEGILRRAQALRIARLMGEPDGMSLTTIRCDRQTFASLTVGFNVPLPDGADWELRVDGQPVDAEAKVVSDSEVSFDFGEPQDWLRESDLIWKVQLSDRESGRLVGFPLLRS